MSDGVLLIAGSQNWACAHYVMVSKIQWKPFWLATQLDPQNDWTATQNRVNTYSHRPHFSTRGSRTYCS